MAIDPNERELTTWGIAGGLRSGFITFILALLIMAVVYLYIDKSRSDRRIYDDQERRRQDQERLYKEMIEYMRPEKERLNYAVDTVIKASTRAIESSERLDSLSNQFQQSKPSTK